MTKKILMKGCLLKVDKKDFGERLLKVEKKDFDERLLKVEKKILMKGC